MSPRHHSQAIRTFLGVCPLGPPSSDLGAGHSETLAEGRGSCLGRPSRPELTEGSLLWI